MAGLYRRVLISGMAYRDPNEKVSVPIQRLDLDLPLPATAHTGDAGIDLHARIDIVLPARGGRALVPTGVAVAIPVGFFGQVVPRSGLALKHGVTLVNTPGIIDSGYRGEDNGSVLSELLGLSEQQIKDLYKREILSQRLPNKNS